MANRNKQDKFILIVSENPSIAYVEAARLAGYSRKGWRVVASRMRKHAGVQAKIAAIRNQELSATPTPEAYHCQLALASQAAQRGDANAWIHVRIAEHYARELAQQPQEQQDKPVVVRVDFVESELPPEQAQTVNKFLGQFEAQVGLPQGWSGRLTTPEVEPEPPRPVERKPAKVKPAPKEDLWLHCQQHGSFWNEQSCPSCRAISWQEQAYAKARSAVQ